jgi:uroporphyrinogen decarboxylase
MDFCPSVYEHAARVIGRTPWEVSRDGGLLAQGHIEAFRLYSHHPVVVGIDIYNLEAEAYGARVQRASGTGIPAVTQFPCSCVEDLLSLPPFDPDSAGRVPMTLEAAQAVTRACPRADVRVPVAGPFSVAGNLAGLERLLSAVADRPDLVRAALVHLVEGQIRLCRAIHGRGLGIAFFESAAAPPLLSPRQFREIELPALKRMLPAVAAITGSAPAFIMGGDTSLIIEAIMETGTGYVCCPAESDQRRFMEKMREHPEVTVRINMDPRPLVAVDSELIEKEVDRVLALAQNRDRVCIGTGVLPFEVDPQTVLQTRQMVLSRTVQKSSNGIP